MARLRKKDYGPSDRPLRLRIRRDRTVALTGVGGNVSDPDRAFPSSHLFTHDWLIQHLGGIASRSGDTLTLSLCNGSATYRLVNDPEETRGVQGALVDSSLTDAPKINEKRALAVAEEVRAERIAEAADLYGVTKAQAEKALLASGALSPTATTEQKDGEV